MEDMHKAGYGEGLWNFHALSEHATFPKSPRVHQPRSSLNSVLLGSYGGFIT